MNFEVVVDIGSPREAENRNYPERCTIGEAASVAREGALRTGKRAVIERQPAT